MRNLSLYLDVAGHPHDSKVMCCAGFVSTEEKWLKFEQRWNELLKLYGMSGGFHMTDFEREYRTHPKHWIILENLISAISEYSLAAFSSRVQMDHYLNVNSHYFLEEGIGKPYALLARSVAYLADQWVGQTKYEDLSIFVEQGTLHEGDMRECFRRDALPEPIAVGKESPRVQAADWYAWELNHAHISGISRQSLQFMRRLGRPEEAVGSWSPRKLKACLEFFGIPKRVDCPENAKVVFHNNRRRVRHRSIKDR